MASVLKKLQKVTFNSKNAADRKRRVFWHRYILMLDKDSLCFSNITGELLIV